MRKFYPLFISLIIFVVAILFLLPCSPEESYACSGSMSGVVGQPMLVYSFAFFVISIILIFVSRPITMVWTKFAVIYFVIAAAWVSFTPEECRSPLNLCLDKELLSWWLSGLFVVISLGIIIYKKIKERRTLPTSSN